MSNLPAKKPSNKPSTGPRKENGTFAKGYGKGIAGPGTTNWASKRRAACEQAFDKAVTTDEFYKIAVRLRNIALIDSNDHEILPSILRAIEMVFQYRMGKPRQAIDIEVSQTTQTFEQRLVMAKVAAQLIRNQTTDFEIVDGTLAESRPAQLPPPADPVPDVREDGSEPDEQDPT